MAERIIDEVTEEEVACAIDLAIHRPDLREEALIAEIRRQCKQPQTRSVSSSQFAVEVAEA